MFSYSASGEQRGGEQLTPSGACRPILTILDSRALSLVVVELLVRALGAILAELQRRQQRRVKGRRTSCVSLRAPPLHSALRLGFGRGAQYGAFLHLAHDFQTPSYSSVLLLRPASAQKPLNMYENSLGGDFWGVADTGNAIGERSKPRKRSAKLSKAAQARSEIRCLRRRPSLAPS